MINKFKELIERTEFEELIKLMDLADSSILNIIINTENEVLNG
jgi:succinate dehydrogenase flavin-adding protein (antitoxin of CptAB toxin-antitoxin module)